MGTRRRNLTERLKAALGIRLTRTRLAVAVLSVLALAWAIIFDASERLHEFSRAHEDWNLDEFLSALIVLGLASLVFQLLRSRDLRREVRRRELAELQLDRAFQTMHQGLSMFDADRRLVICNRRFIDIYKLPPHLAAPGTSVDDVLRHLGDHVVRKTGDVEYVQELTDAIAKGEPYVRFCEFADGRTICISYEWTGDGGWVATHEDITERRQLEARLNHLAHYDALTGLVNRTLLRERLDEALAGLDGSETLAVLCLDLDHFKHINDTLGHPTGDALLKKVAERLNASVHATDLVARLGGDEFAVIQTGGTPRTATELASRILEAFNEPYEVSGHNLPVGVSIGIAMAPADGTDPDALFKNADLALYLAKGEGRGAYRFFETDMDMRMHARRQLELDLRQALAKGEFELHYQPILELETNKIGGFEALLRWNHPSSGRVAPGDFIPLAEETGLIVPIGEWVLRRACADAAGWAEELSVSVNVSPMQFKNQNLVQTVFNALAASGLAPARLELEITETVLLHNTEATLDTLRRLRALGVRIAMDDFGVGYSSLSYFQSFHFDKIKLDRSFINGLNRDESSLAILRAVASLGANLSITTTAEGVETEEQLEQIRKEGISQVQGYLVSPPRAAQDLRELTRPAKAKPAQVVEPAKAVEPPRKQYGRG
jgi:diguanylate cyclase (GGDEF)-like protein